MKLLVQYTGQLRAAVGRPEEDLELPEGSNLGDLLMHLTTRLDRAAKPHLVTDTDEVRPSLLVVVNGRAVSAKEVHGTMLNPGDVVTLLPPIGGG